MSNPNWTQPMPLSFIPNGQLVTFTALHQSALIQYVQIIDSNNKPIAFKTMTNTSANFPISGSGTNVGFLDNGAGSFIMQQGFQIQFGNSGGMPSLAQMTNPSMFYIQGQNFGGGVFFAVEDQGGTDYNDTSLSLQWYTSAG